MARPVPDAFECNAACDLTTQELMEVLLARLQHTNGIAFVATQTRDAVITHLSQPVYRPAAQVWRAA